MENKQEGWMQRFDETFSNVGWLPENKARILNFIEETLAQEASKATALCLQSHKDSKELLIKKIIDAKPGAWFPGGALELKAKFFDEVISIITSLK